MRKEVNCENFEVDVLLLDWEDLWELFSFGRFVLELIF